MTTAPSAGQFTHAADAGLNADLAAPLQRLRASARRLLVTREAAWIVACLGAAIVGIGLADYALRMPWGLRLAFWVAGIALLVLDARKRLLPALGFNPPLREIALRLERTRPATAAGLRDVLATGLELSDTADSWASPALRDQVVHTAAARLRMISPSRAALSGIAARNALLLALLAMVPIVTLMVWSPRMASIGLRRVLTPWTTVSWPKRTAVADVTSIHAHPLGAAVPLRAAITRTDRAPGKTDVWAMYRVVDEGRESPARRALLTAQGRVVPAPASQPGDSERGELYERLVEPTGVAIAPDASPSAAARSLTLEYWFETDDDRTAPVRIAIVEPPAVVTADAEIQPPPYAAAPGDFLSGSRDLGNGRDERASVGPLLAGSRVSLRLGLNKPLPAPANTDAAFPGVDLPAGLSIDARGAQWTVSWIAEQPLRLPLALADEHGIRADRDAAFQFTVVPDRAPAAAVVEPTSDESVLATAVLSVTGEGRDDVGLSWAALDVQTARVPPGSEGAPPEPAGAPSVLARRDAASETGGGPLRQIRVVSEIDLSTMSLKPRDEVWLAASAKDAFASDSASHEAVRSSVRRLRIIAESDLIEQVRTELAGVRQAALRLDQDQADIARRAEVSAPGDLRPLQQGLTQRLTPQSEVLRRLSERVQRNNLTDRALTGLLQDSGAALQQAQRSSAQAEQSFEAAERAGAEQAERDRLAGEATQQQRQVRDQLGRLISMLDRGQDGYTVRREVQRLIDEQRRLIDQTKELGQQTRGQRAADLPQAQRDALAQASDQQQELARRAAQMLSDMAKRSVDLQRQDPALSQAMQKSAERGRQDQVPDKQRQASEQIRQNQTGSANQSQEQALQSLQQMMEELDRTERQRDEALKRVLEDVIQSIQALVESQQRELAALDRALPAAAFQGLDAGMIRLNADTIGVADKIRTMFRELAPVADMVDDASRAQATAVAVFRSPAPDGAEADRAERLSLDRLRAAREEAERLRREADDKDQNRKREDLRRAYQESLEAQVALRAKTTPLVGVELDRRQRAGVRGLSDQQIQIRSALTTLKDKNPGLVEARLFEYAHKRLDEITGRAATTLAEGAVTAAVDRDQLGAVRLLQSLVEALKDPKPRNFRDSPDGGSGSGGGQGQQGGKQQLILPIAELRLLRLMQQEVADMTRAADDDRAAGAPNPAVIEDLGRMQDELTRRAEQLLQPEETAPDRPAEPAEPAQTPSFEARPHEPPAQPPSRPPAPSEPAAPPQDPPGNKPPDPLPTLDELLGISPGAPKTDGAPDPAREELERQLSPDQASGAQAELLSLLQQASQRLGAQRDPGVATQRAQAEAIKRLDQLIDMQERNQRQSQSRSRQNKQQQQQQQQQAASQQTQSQPNPTAGDNRQFVDPPARQEGPLKPPAPGAGARWGSLPEHIRSALTQGSSDRYSALYRALTSEYYKRLAEEPRPAGGGQ